MIYDYGKMLHCGAIQKIKSFMKVRCFLIVFIQNHFNLLFVKKRFYFPQILRMKKYRVFKQFMSFLFNILILYICFNSSSIEITFPLTPTFFKQNNNSMKGFVPTQPPLWETTIVRNSDHTVISVQTMYTPILASL